ncbi:hypothetical protein FT663_02321 [Candidozyma haemuli var. vulneris]|uniref:Membrane insertase YidC/Oxa/ALB C-terminal domain-containing protein n=1 Tax=Candidozyma haemuli TaxID=45357 RepID=A0A2V1ASA4_9ASCO|nr:hypothetical protein CXQ85_004243 [[Candida] haemuloni]KAF3990042.1 hypothetical protein FT662_02493 [[Candida] haemuloni var. vulneris]KAF3992394.1 hypothetical protein FT663_02321 [[Candida] haemuloni var. vulneris]PVH20739.1 hypothetical protein CXQ85_004243 [[Candida] haemuloni]
MLRLTRPLGLKSIPRNHGFVSPALRIQKRDFSLEPTAVITVLTESVEHIHTLTGLPWWAVIPLTTFTLRGVWTLPLAVMQRLRVQKQNALRPIVAATAPILRMKLAREAQKALKASQKAGASPGMASPAGQMKYDEIMVLSAKETRKRQKKLFRDHGVQLYKNFFLPAAQVPLWVCMSMTFRNLSGWSTWDSLANKPLDPSLYDQGALWFTDLTTLDPLHVFPIAIGIVAILNVEWTFKTFQLMKPPGRKRAFRPTIFDSLGNLSRMGVVFLMAISLHAPTALTLYWLSSQLFSLVQNVVLDLVFPLNYTPHKRMDFKKSKSETAESVIN